MAATVGAVTESRDCGGERPGPDGIVGNRAVLAEAAVRYVLAGWPVVPVRLPVAGDGPAVPLRSLVSHRAAPDVATAQEWWTTGTYGIGVLAGIVFDMLVVPARIGPATAELLRRSRPCAVGHPDGWWLFPVRVGSEWLTDLPRGSGISLLGAGTQVVVPPTPVGRGCVEWQVRGVGLAEVIGRDSWGESRLPHGMTTQQAAARAWVMDRQVSG